MSRRLAPVIFAVALTACGGANSDGSAGTTAAPVTARPTVAARPPAEVTIEGADLTLKGADALTAGWVKFTVANDGPQPRGATLVRLKDGTTLSALEAAAKQGFEQMIPLVAPVGGPTAGAGKTVAMLVDLPAGHYAFVAGKGMVRPLTVQVAADGAATIAPKSDATVTLRDFLFDMPDTLPSGSHIWNVPNAGQQLHEIGVGRLQAGKTAADLTAYLSKPAGPPPLDLLASVSTIPAGGSALLSLDLEPGVYYALCFLPDPGTHKPHVALGMMREFTIK